MLFFKICNKQNKSFKFFKENYLQTKYNLSSKILSRMTIYSLLILLYLIILIVVNINISGKINLSKNESSINTTNHLQDVFKLKYRKTFKYNKSFIMNKINRNLNISNEANDKNNFFDEVNGISKLYTYVEILLYTSLVFNLIQIIFNILETKKKCGRKYKVFLYYYNCILFAIINSIIVKIIYTLLILTEKLEFTTIILIYYCLNMIIFLVYILSVDSNFKIHIFTNFFIFIMYFIVIKKHLLISDIYIIFNFLLELILLFINTVIESKNIKDFAYQYFMENQNLDLKNTLDQINYSYVSIDKNVNFSMNDNFMRNLLENKSFRGSLNEKILTEEKLDDMINSLNNGNEKNFKIKLFSYIFHHILNEVDFSKDVLSDIYSVRNEDDMQEEILQKSDFQINLKNNKFQIANGNFFKNSVYDDKIQLDDCQNQSNFTDEYIEKIIKLKSYFDKHKEFIIKINNYAKNLQINEIRKKNRLFSESNLSLYEKKISKGKLNKLNTINCTNHPRNYLKKRTINRSLTFSNMKNLNMNFKHINSEKEKSQFINNINCNDFSNITKIKSEINNMNNVNINNINNIFINHNDSKFPLQENLNGVFRINEHEQNYSNIEFDNFFVSKNKSDENKLDNFRTSYFVKKNLFMEKDKNTIYYDSIKKFLVKLKQKLTNKFIPVTMNINQIKGGLLYLNDKFELLSGDSIFIRKNEISDDIEIIFLNKPKVSVKMKKSLDFIRYPSISNNQVKNKLKSLNNLIDLSKEKNETYINDDNQKSYGNKNNKLNEKNEREYFNNFFIGIQNKISHEIINPLISLTNYLKNCKENLKENNTILNTNINLNSKSTLTKILRKKTSGKITRYKSSNNSLMNNRILKKRKSRNSLTSEKSNKFPINFQEISIIPLKRSNPIHSKFANSNINYDQNYDNPNLGNSYSHSNLLLFNIKKSIHISKMVSYILDDLTSILNFNLENQKKTFLKIPVGVQEYHNYSLNKISHNFYSQNFTEKSSNFLKSNNFNNEKLLYSKNSMKETSNFVKTKNFDVQEDHDNVFLNDDIDISKKAELLKLDIGKKKDAKYVIKVINDSSNILKKPIDESLIMKNKNYEINENKNTKIHLKESIIMHSGIPNMNIFSFYKISNKMIINYIESDKPLNTSMNRFSKKNSISNATERELNQCTNLNINKLINKIIKISKTKISLLNKNINISVNFRTLKKTNNINTHDLVNNINNLIKEENMIKIFSSSNLIEQSLFNLISNAIKFTRVGKIVVEIVNEDKFLTIKIKDTGIGIEVETLKKLGHPFVKSNKANNLYGIGMGVFLCKNNIKKLKGLFEVISGEELGTTFIIKIPNNIENLIEENANNIKYNLKNAPNSNSISCNLKNNLISLNNKSIFNIHNASLNINNNLLACNLGSLTNLDSGDLKSSENSKFNRKKTANKMESLKNQNPGPIYNKIFSSKNSANINDSSNLNTNAMSKGFASPPRININRPNNYKELENNKKIIYVPEGISQIMQFSISNSNKLTNKNQTHKINNINDINNINNINNFNSNRINSKNNNQNLQKNFILNVKNKKNIEIARYNDSERYNPEFGLYPNLPRKINKKKSLSNITKRSMMKSIEMHEFGKKPKSPITYSSPRRRSNYNIRDKNNNFNESKFSKNLSILKERTAESLFGASNQDLIIFNSPSINKFQNTFKNQNESTISYESENFQSNNMHNYGFDKIGSDTRNRRFSQIRSTSRKNTIRNDDYAMNLNRSKIKNIRSLSLFYDKEYVTSSSNMANPSKKNLFSRDIPSDYSNMNYLGNNNLNAFDKMITYKVMNTESNIDDMSNVKNNSKKKNSMAFKQTNNTLNNFQNYFPSRNSRINFEKNEKIEKNKKNEEETYKKNNKTDENYPDSSKSMIIDDDNLNYQSNKSDYNENDLDCLNIQHDKDTIRILIVDDELMIRKSHKKLLEKFFSNTLNDKLVIEECEDGMECLYKIYLGFKSGIQYDMVITDETMNMLNGVRLARIIYELRRDSVINNIQVFLVTSYKINNFNTINADIIFANCFSKPLKIQDVELLLKIYTINLNLN